MRLFRLEVKRVMKTRMTWILLLAAFMLSIVMAYIPVTFAECVRMDENGNKTTLKGLNAIHYMKELREEFSGEVTPSKVTKAVEVYQFYLNEYGVETIYELPETVYWGDIMVYAPLIRGVREIFASTGNGIAPEISEINPNEIASYYEQCEKRFDFLMAAEERNYPSAQQKGKEMYAKVNFPFYYYYGIGSESIDYQCLLFFIITIFCAVIAAPVFSSDYQTGADDILRCTKYGHIRLGVTKVMSAIMICGVSFLLCLILWIVVTNSLFGWESTKTSVQMVYSLSTMLSMNMGELEWVNGLAVFVSVLATVSFTLFLSSRMKSTVPSLAFAIMFCVLPVIVYVAVPGALGDWLRCILPSGGIGLQNCLLYAMIDCEFLHLGSLSFWNAEVIITAAAVEIPLFACLAVFGYNKVKQ